MSTSIPVTAQALLRLFQEELAEVRFPGMDAAVLVAAAARVRDAESEVHRAALALEAAQQLQRDAVEQLGAKSQRALAYARIYAQDNPAVRARLESLANPVADDALAAATVEPRRRRGRPPKSERPVLFHEPESGHLTGADAPAY